MSSTTPVELFVGVDTHKDVHAAVAVTASGVRLAATAVPASSQGYATLEAWARSMGSVQAFGIEGTGSYGAGLSRFLRERGHAVVEVNRPNRQLRHQKARAMPLMPRAPLAPCWPARPMASPSPARARSR